MPRYFFGYTSSRGVLDRFTGKFPAYGWCLSSAVSVSYTHLTLPTN